MAVTAQAVFFTAPNQVEVRSFGLPEPGDNDVVVRTLYSGISAGTEMWSLTGRFHEKVFPAIPGYQKTGVVEKIGAKVKNLTVGDQVFLRSTRVAPGVQVQWAGHTSYSVIDADDPMLFKLPGGLDPVAGAMLSVAAIGFRGAGEVMPIEVGETVVVLGLGIIGQFSAQTAYLRGANVVAVDLMDRRLELASQLSRAITLNPQRTDVAARLKEICPNGADAIIDTTAHVDTINASFKWLKHGGRYCLQGFYPGCTPLELLWPHIHELVIYNPIDSTPKGHRWCAEATVAKRLEIRPLVSHVLPARAAPEAYQMLLKRQPDVMGIVLEW